jgi:hypothetical protein
MTFDFKVGNLNDKVHPALSSFVFVCSTIIIILLFFIVLERGEEVVQGIKLLENFN